MLTSAAATTIIKKTNICASLPKVGSAFAAVLIACIFEKASNNKLTAFSINSTHIKIMIALRRTSTPIIPMVNKVSAKAMYDFISIFYLTPQALFKGEGR